MGFSTSPLYPDSGTADALKINGTFVSGVKPANGQTLVYSSSIDEYVPQTPSGGGGAGFQPNPEYAADEIANAFVQGYGVFVKETQSFGTFYNLGGFFTEVAGVALVYNGTMFISSLANKWALISDDGESNYQALAVANATGGAYPWSVTFNNGIVVTKQALARLGGAPLAATAAEGTSAYAARADHVHPFPTAAQIGAATLDGSGKVPPSQLPSYVDDVIEVANFAALPKFAYTISGSTVAGVNGEYVITGTLYNGIPTYAAASLGNTLRRRGASGLNPSRWEIVNGATQMLLSNSATSTPTGTSWPSSTAVVYSENAGQGGKIYVVLDSGLDTGKCYRWSGSTYIEISSTLELDDLQIPDAFASVSADVAGFITIDLPLTGTLNGKPRYDGNFNGDTSCIVYWTGTNWKAQAEYTGDGYSYGESIATGNTAYPWQATGWTNNGGVTRVGTYNAALAPAPLGANAYSGVGTKAAREDHVHPLPTPADIGAATKTDSILNALIFG